MVALNVFQVCQKIRGGPFTKLYSSFSDTEICNNIMRKYGVKSYLKLDTAKNSGLRGLIMNEQLQYPQNLEKNPINLLEIPFYSIICDTSQHIQQYPPWVKQLIEKDVVWEMKFGAMLMWAIQNVEFWKEYEMLLPKFEELMTPFVFSDENLNLLIEKSLLADIFEWRDEIKQTLQQYMRCVGCVQSRAFRFTQQDQSLDAFVPFLDLANHHPDAGCYSDFDLNKNMITLKTTQKFQVGDEVFNFYGYQTDKKLFEQYGIILSANKYDRIRIESQGKLKRDSLMDLVKNKGEISQKIKQTGSWQEAYKNKYKENQICEKWQDVFGAEKANVIFAVGTKILLLEKFRLNAVNYK